MAESGISAGHTMARGVTVARLTLDQLVLVRIQAGQLRGSLLAPGEAPPASHRVPRLGERVARR
jgi:hypothetical protein